MNLYFLLFILFVLMIFFFYTNFAILWFLSIVGITLIIFFLLIGLFHKLYLDLKNMPPKEPSKKIIEAANETKKIVIETMKLERSPTEKETKLLEGTEKMIKGLKDWFS